MLLLLIAGVYLHERKPRAHRVAHAPKAAPPKASGRAPLPAANPAVRARVAERYNTIISTAGGHAAWLKRPARSDAESGEALLLASALPRVLAEVNQQAATDGLSVAREPKTQNASGAAETDITLSQSGEPICSWHIREVPRLYRAAIVIDDLGQRIEPTRELLALHCALTFSVLPRLPASRDTSAEAALAGREVMLHLPMEPIGDRVSPGQGAILVGMRAPEVARIVSADLDSVPNARGVNNHMGSRATSDAALMSEVMQELSRRRLYFIDSRTAPSTVALEAARQAGILAFSRSVFLDDTETVDYTLAQLRAFRAVVERQGSALAIGHPHPTTIAALRSFVPEFERDDIELVPASQLVTRSEVAQSASKASKKLR